MVKNLKKQLLGIAVLLIVTILILLKSNLWKNFVISKVNESLSSHGWTMDIEDISGHILAKTRFSNITFSHKEFHPIYIQSLDINIGILPSLFGFPTLDLLFTESVSFDLSNGLMKFKSKSPVENIGITIPLNIKSFYCSSNGRMITEKKEIKLWR